MKPITVVETPEFAKRAKALLPESEKLALIDLVARRYREGVVIEGTGGLRKMRFARPGEGKSGGYRFIYYFYNEDYPVFLITIYAKNAQENISDAQRNAMKRLSSLLVAAYARK